MNPITSHHRAQTHMEELRREAEQRRVAGKSRPGVSHSTRIRTMAGNWLIGAGERLLPGQTIRTAGFQR